MATGSNYEPAIVIINKHEPEGETAARLLELAAEKGYEPSVVEAQRGEHDAGLSFRVPEDVAEAFNSERASTWPKIENDDEMDSDQQADAAGVDGDAYAADGTRKAKAARAANAANNDDEDPKTVPDRKSRTGKA